MRSINYIEENSQQLVYAKHGKQFERLINYDSKKKSLNNMAYLITTNTICCYI